MADPTLKTGLRYSLAIHAALIVLLCGGIKGCGKGSNSAQPSMPSANSPDKHEDIVDKEMEVSLKEMTPQEEAEADAQVQKPKYTERECGDRNWYGGVGIEMIPFNGKLVVEHVYKGYPGDKAGLQDGDILLNYSELRGDPGTPITIQYWRNGEQNPRFIETIREKICIRQAVTP